jgi:hypothetical protein
MDSVYNNTFVPLNAGGLWQGRAEVVNKYNVACVSCASDTDGLLSLLQSQNDINYDFAMSYNITAGIPFNLNDRIKAKNYRVMFENTSASNQTYLRITTTYKDDIRDNLDIRPLESTKDSLSIPALDACIVDNKLVVSIESVTVTGVTVDISGQTVEIGGQTVKSQIYDYNDYAITSQLVGSKRGLDVNNIGTVRAYEGTTIKEIGAFTDSHNKVNLQTYDDALNDKINSSDIIGEDTGAIKVYVSNTANNPVKCDVSGQSMIVNTISGYSTSVLQTNTNDKLDTLNVSALAINDNVDKLVDRAGDIQANIYYTEGAQIWADSAPVPTVNVLDPNGWLYTNTNTGNAMNLYYFNGANEIRRLDEVLAQYAVVRNLSTKINDKMIFGIYTKSGSSFFTTRVTHSQPAGADMFAGGRYLLYWGDIPDNLFPNLPRIDLTDVVTTGPANPLEEVLSISLGTDTGAPAGDINISVEVLGVSFNGETRSYNLLGSPTEYQTLVNIRNNSDDIKYKTNFLEFYNESGINELMTYDRASETKLETINTSIANKTLNKSTSSIDISGQILNIGNFPTNTNVSGSVTVSNFPATQNVSGTVAISTLPAIAITNTSFEVSNFPATQNVSGTVAISTLPAIAITNTSFEVSNFPATQNVSGTVAISTLPAIAITNTSFEVSNFPEEQVVSGTVDVATLPAIAITNTSFDAKVRDGNNNVITSTVYGIDGVRGLDVSIKNATQAEPLQVEIGATNVINTFSTNLPAFYPIDAGGALSSALGALNVNLRNTDGNAIGITGTPLIVESNLITGFALETGGNLATVATNSNKFKFTGDNLKCEVVNAGTNSLSVTETNPLTNYALEDGGHLEAIKINTDKNTYDASGNLKVNLATGSITVSAVNIKDSSGNNIYADGSGNLKTNIQNSSIDVHNKVYHNGNWIDLVGASNGHLIVNSSTQDGNGTDITSTLNGAKQSLDVNVANTGALKVDISGSSILEGKIAVFDALSFPYIERISVGAGADIFSYVFGNFLNNTTINTGALSTTITFAAGHYGRRLMLMYRDGATSSTDSITYYTDSNFGTPEPLLLQTVYPIVNGGYRWSNVIINILPFTSIKIRNDSTTINNTNVYLTVVRV